MSNVPEQAERAAPFRVVIAGGGVAAIEAALALRATARPWITLTIATSADDFIYRPFAVVRPFQARPTYRIELARVAADLDAQLVVADAVAVDDDRHELVLSNGQALSYDALLIAIGARAEAIVGGGRSRRGTGAKDMLFARSLAPSTRATRGASPSLFLPSSPGRCHYMSWPC